MFPKPARSEAKKYEKFLAPGEELAFATRIGDRYFWSLVLSYTTIFLLLVAVLPLSTYFNLLPIWIALPIFLSSIIVIFPLMKILQLRHSLTYIFTNRRVIIKKGIFSLSITTAPYDKITHIVVNQKFLYRIFYDSGTITLHTAGPTPVEMDLLHVEKPIAVKNLLDDLIHQERTNIGQPISQPWPNITTGEVVAIS